MALPTKTKTDPDREVVRFGFLTRWWDKSLIPLLRGHQNRIEALEARVEALDRESLRYRGVFDPETWYRVGDTVTRSGSLWRCQEGWSKGATPGGPDERDRAWVLILKKGAAA